MVEYILIIININNIKMTSDFFTDQGLTLLVGELFY